MRYLHQEYPEEWPVDRLAKSFPVSKEGVVKILKSKFVPKTVDEIIRHDERVTRNWKALTGGDKEPDGPLASRYKQLVEDGKVWTLQHASGIRSMPMPNKSTYVPTVKLKRDNSTGEPGLFESMVKSYCEKKAANGENPPESKELLEQNEAKNLKLLQSVTSEKLLKGGDIKGGALPPLERKKTVNYKEAFTYADPALEPEKAEAVVNRDLYLQSLLDHVEGISTINADTLHRRGRGRGRGQRSSSKLPSDVDPGMYNTEKIDSHQVTFAQGENSNIEQEQGSPKYVVIPEQAEAWSQIKYEKKLGKSEEDIEAYIYDRQTGYQYPLGRKADIVDKIEVHNEDMGRDSTWVVYQKGKDFYDEDGDFLFRIPWMGVGGGTEKH